MVYSCDGGMVLAAAGRFSAVEVIIGVFAGNQNEAGTETRG